MKQTPRNRGSVSALVLLFSMAMVIALLGAAALSIQSMSRSVRERTAIQAFQAAQAGLELQLTESFNNLPNTSGRFQTTDVSRSGDLNSMAPGNNATTIVQPNADDRIAWFTSTVTYRGVTRSLRTYATARNVGIWNNAIFAGTGAAGQAINGNVDVRGSVHILGDGEAYSDLNDNAQWDPAEPFTDTNRNGRWDPGEPYTDSNGDGVWSAAEPYNDTNNNGSYDPPLTQTDLNSSFSGNAHIGNHYSGMPLNLESMVPNPPRINNIETLSAEVRVKHGRIAISGSATIGASGLIDGGTSKAKIDGSFVSDGYTGNAGSSSVFSDNGTGNAYDLGPLGIKFPLIEGVGAPAYVTGSGTYANQQTFFDQRALNVPISTITATTAAFSYGPDQYGNSISFTPQVGNNNNVTTPARLVINGIIKVPGSLTIGPGNSTIRYEGSGTFYAPGDINLRTNILPATGRLFPTTARIGYVSKENINIATGNGDSQLSLAGAFYAQGMIRSAKQNQIAGTFVANYFDMGTNVPNIYQVPSLVDNMPPGMPGDKNYYTLRVTGWRER